MRPRQIVRPIGVVRLMKYPGRKEKMVRNIAFNYCRISPAAGDAALLHVGMRCPRLTTPDELKQKIKTMDKHFQGIALAYMRARIEEWRSAENALRIRQHLYELLVALDEIELLALTAEAEIETEEICPTKEQFFADLGKCCVKKATS
jgi:hypothetical protein